MHISPATAGRIVRDLIRLGVIYEGDQYQAGPTGSPSTELHFNSQIACILAVDLRLTKAYAAITDLAGHVLAKDVKQLDLSTPESSQRDLIGLLHDVAQAGPGLPPLRAVVIGVPSVVDPVSGFVESAPSLGWESLPLGQIIKDEFQLPVLIENDANLAALGEYWKGAARGKRYVVCVSVGTGVGAGIIIDGEIYRGAQGAAGEVAFFIMDIDTLRDNVGHVGMLEKRAARDGVIQRARIVAQRYPASRLAEFVDRSAGQINARDIFTLAIEGDPAARTVFDETIDLLTIVISNVSVVLDPEVIVLGGPSDWRWDAVVEAIEARLETAPYTPVALRASAFQRDAVIVGATAAAIGIKGVLPE